MPGSTACLFLPILSYPLFYSYSSYPIPILSLSYSYSSYPIPILFLLT